MTNNIQVQGSLRTDAAHCSELPDELKAKQLCLVHLFFRQWTGAASMTRTDYRIGKDGSLPPEAVTVNLGQKRLIDPKHLRVFETLKKRAESLLADVGVPFCKGIAVPVDKAQDVLKDLAALAGEFNRERDAFAQRINDLGQEWISKNPQFAEEIREALKTQKDVAGRINADFSVMTFQPCSLDNTGSLSRQVSGLYSEVVKDVCQRAGLLWKRSLFGKTEGDLTQRTLSTIRKMRSKLMGLRFLSKSISPLIDVLDRLLAAMPTKGGFSKEQYSLLCSVMSMLADKDTVLAIGDGSQSLDNLFKNLLPEASRANPSSDMPKTQPTSAPEPETVPVVPVESVSTSETENSVAAPAPEVVKQPAIQTQPPVDDEYPDLFAFFGEPAPVVEQKDAPMTAAPAAAQSADQKSTEEAAEPLPVSEPESKPEEAISTEAQAEEETDGNIDDDDFHDEGFAPMPIPTSPNQIMLSPF